MAAGLIASLIPLLEGSAAGVAAKGTMDMNKKKEDSKAILDDGLLSKSKTQVATDKAKDYFKTLSRAEKDELMIDLVMGGLTTREAVNIINTGYIGKDSLKKLSPDLRRKISRMSGQDLEAQLGFGGNGPDDDDNKKEKAKKLRDEAEKEQREWEKKETDFQKNDPKVKRRVNAKQTMEKVKAETPGQIDPKDPQFKGNSPTQKMEQGVSRMKDAIKNGRAQEWEYQHVTPTSNIPMRP